MFESFLSAVALILGYETHGYEGPAVVVSTTYIIK